MGTSINVRFALGFYHAREGNMAGEVAKARWPRSRPMPARNAIHHVVHQHEHGVIDGAETSEVISVVPRWAKC
jgi:hypothetical protein